MGWGSGDAGVSWDTDGKRGQMLGTGGAGAWHSDGGHGQGQRELGGSSAQGLPRRQQHGRPDLFPKQGLQEGQVDGDGLWGVDELDEWGSDEDAAGDGGAGGQSLLFGGRQLENGPW